MATVNSTGIIGTTFEQYVTMLENLFRTVLGDNVTLDDQSPVGQIVGTLALTLSQNDDVLVHESNGYNAHSASGSQQDNLFGTLNVIRREGSAATAVVTLSGTVGRTIPSGHRVRSDNDDVFVLSQAVVIGAGGTVAGNYVSEEVGNITADVGEITTIVDVIAGLDSVNNAVAAVPGTEEQSDQLYRAKYFREIFKNARGVLEAVIARINADVSGVTDINGAENDQATAQTIDGLSIAGRSIAVVVEGGADADIAAAILAEKSGGCGTVGGVTVSVPRTIGPDIDISFYRPSSVDVEVVLVTTADSTFPENGLNLLEERILQYINGTFNPGGSSPDLFETDGLTIAENLNKYRLLTPINSVPGHDVTSLQIRVKGGSFVDTIPVNLNQKIRVVSEADISVTVNS